MARKWIRSLYFKAHNPLCYAGLVKSKEGLHRPHVQLVELWQNQFPLLLTSRYRHEIQRQHLNQNRNLLPQLVLDLRGVIEENKHGCYYCAKNWFCYLSHSRSPSIVLIIFCSLFWNTILLAFHTLAWYKLRHTLGYYIHSTLEPFTFYNWFLPLFTFLITIYQSTCSPRFLADNYKHVGTLCRSWAFKTKKYTGWVRQVIICLFMKRWTL